MRMHRAWVPQYFPENHLSSLTYEKDGFLPKNGAALKLSPINGAHLSPSSLTDLSPHLENEQFR